MFPFNKTRYRIKKGRSKAAGFNFKISKGNKNETWDCIIKKGWYDRPSAEEKTGKIKLVGYTNGLLPKIKKHYPGYTVCTKIPFTDYCLIKPTHWNSYRFAIQPDFRMKGLWRIFSYCYVDGVRKVEELQTVLEGVPFAVTNKRMNNVIVQLVNNNGISMTKVPVTNSVTVGYFSFPFFKGDVAAQSELVFNINRH